MNLSVIIPLYNERNNIEPLIDELKTCLEDDFDKFEVIVVDDGSDDGSTKLLRKISSNFSFIKIIELRKNFGQANALQAGIDEARGNLICTMDADMQNDPRDIKKMLNVLEKDNLDLVNGWRDKRSDSFGKKFFSQLASSIRIRLFKTDLNDYGCTMRLMRREAAQKLNLSGDMHRYIPPVLHSKGFELGEVKVNHRSRNAGKSKYSIYRLPKGFSDMLKILFWQKFSDKIFFSFNILSLITMATGLISGLIAVNQKINNTSLSDTAATNIALFMIIISIQIFSTGLIADIGLKDKKIQPKEPKYSIKQIN